MIRTTIALTTLLISSACAALFAQGNAPADSSESAAPYNEAIAASTPYIIFSNLDPSSANLYNPDASVARPVAGREASGGQIEEWTAVRFIPKTDVQANVLMAAIGYISGTRLVNLGIYANNDILETVGEPIPGGQGSTQDIPAVGECCQMVKVTLPENGVTLTGGTIYWLVASPDDVNAPTFRGGWQVSNFGSSAGIALPMAWNPQAGKWPAAQIQGTRLQTLGPVGETKPGQPNSDATTASGKVTLFTNLNRASSPLYLAGTGALITGNALGFLPEIWEALPFTPKVDGHVKTLAAAIGSIFTVRQINLGLYSDNDGVPGTLLPGGQGGTADFPDFGVCCALAEVRLPGDGVALTAGTQYWLVASPDDTIAPMFEGAWQESSLALAAYEDPPYGWTNISGEWFAAEIRGTNP